VIANNAQIYQGGAQVLHNIRGVVTTPVFWAGIKAYYRRYQNGNATTDDFRREMEQACRTAGDRCPESGRDLTWLFTQLLNRGGALQVSGTWSYDASGQVQLRLEQTQAATPYRMPIEVRITTIGANGQRTRVTHTVQLTDARHVFQLPSAAEPTEVELDPEAWVMMQGSLTRAAGIAPSSKH
jgi:aminopeptidase N